jgi:hypothetical protein
MASNVPVVSVSRERGTPVGGRIRSSAGRFGHRMAPRAATLLVCLAVALLIADPSISLGIKIGLFGGMAGLVVSFLDRRAAALGMLMLLPFTAIALAGISSLFTVGATMFAVAWLLRSLLFDSAETLRVDRSDLWVGLLLGAYALSALAFAGGGGGTLARRALLAFGVYFVLSRSIGTLGDSRNAVGALSVAFSVAAALVLLVPGAAQIVQSEGLSRTGSLGAGVSSANRFGGELVVTILLVWTMFRPFRTRFGTLLRGASIASFVAFIATVSRGAAVALLIGIVVWGIASNRGRFLSRLLIVAALIVAAIAFAPQSFQERFREITTGQQQAYSRLDIWEGGVRMFEQHPLFGVGAGNFPSRLPQYLGSLPLGYTEQDAHSIFLTAIAELGVIGLLLLLGLLAVNAQEALWLARGRPSGYTTQDVNEIHNLGAGLFTGFVVLMVNAATVNLILDPFLFAFLGLLHGTYRSVRNHAG